MAHLKGVPPNRKEETDLVSLRTNIEKVGQCPICLELAKPPVTLCVSGHGTCVTCKGPITKCPICRLPFCSTVPRILNEILHHVHKTCKYYDQGCRIAVSNDHELYCKFRPVKCIFHDEDNYGYCHWEGPAKDFFDHVDETDHLEPIWFGCVDNSGSSTIIFNDFRDFTAVKSLLPVFSINKLFGDQHFIFSHKKIKGSFYLYVNHFPLEKPKVSMYFTFYFTNRDGQVIYQHKVKATVATALDRDVNVEDNVYCLRVPVEELKILLDEDGDLCVTFKMEAKTEANQVSDSVRHVRLAPTPTPPVQNRRDNTSQRNNLTAEQNRQNRNIRRHSNRGNNNPRQNGRGSGGDRGHGNGRGYGIDHGNGNGRGYGRNNGNGHGRNYCVDNGYGNGRGYGVDHSNGRGYGRNSGYSSGRSYADACEYGRGYDDNFRYGDHCYGYDGYGGRY